MLDSVPRTATELRTEPRIEDVVYRDPSGSYLPDTCEPLKAAAARGDVDLWAYGRGNYPGEPLPADVLPQLKSVGMWHASADQGWGLDWHRNEGIEVTCVTAGSVDFSCEDEDFELGAGTVTITRPWQLHRVGRPNVATSRLSWFIIDVETRRPNQEWSWPEWLPMPQADLRRLTELLSHNEHPVWRANKSMLAAVSAMENTLQGARTQPITRLAAAIIEVLVELSDLLEQQVPVLDPYLSSTERAVRSFLERLPERLAEPWTVERMAAECGLGRTRFLHYARQTLNGSPLEYLNSLRIDRARSLLVESDLRVVDVAHSVGFPTSQYFSTIFRKHTSLQPLQLRRLARAEGLRRVGDPALAELVSR